MYYQSDEISTAFAFFLAYRKASNGGLEDAATNSIPYWSPIGTVSSYGSPYEGENAASLSVTSSVTTSSIHQYVRLGEGTYSLSMYINTNQSQGVKVYLKAESSISEHSVIQEIPTNEYYATGAYVFFGMSFTAKPSSVNEKEEFEISVVVSGAPSKTESVTVDNLMLSKTTGAAEYDLLKLGHFESDASDFSPSTFWAETDGIKPITTVDSGIPAFGEVLKIQITPEEYEFVGQTVILANDSIKSQYDEGYYYVSSDPILFTISGWGKGTAQSYADTGLFGIRVKLNYYTSSGTSIESYDFNFDKGITEWQFVSGGFTSNPDKGLLESITVLLLYNDNPGVGYFDNISLVRNSSSTGLFDYNAKGYLSSYKNGWITSWYGYDENDNLTRVISTDRTVIDYEYDSKNRVKKEYHKKYTGTNYCSPNTVEESLIQTITYYAYGYNSFGQSSYVYTYDGADTSKYSATFDEYDTRNGSHIFGTRTISISFGRITRYFSDETTGRLLAVLYPEGNGVCYQYDAIGNLTQALPATLHTEEIVHEQYDEYEDYTYTWTETIYSYVPDQNGASVTYDYDDATNRLRTITTESSVYTFTYDTFGNTSAIDVGSRSLVDYRYNDNNGKINTLVYGNGFQVKYEYDVLDRISEIQYNTGVGGSFETAYSYTYDSAGNLFSAEDHRNGETTIYKYDSLGRFERSYVYDTEDYLNRYGTKVTYDEDSRISMVFHTMDYLYEGGSVYYDSSYYNYWYNTSTGRLSQYRISGPSLFGTIKPLYDGFGRTTERETTIHVDNVAAFYQKYAYQYVTSGNAQSGQIASVVSTVGQTSGGVTSTTYKYTYDKNGNITQIADANDVVQYRYEYDGLGQLVREDNYPLGCTYVYTYDKAGNILNKVQYAFSTGIPEFAEYAYSFSYDDATWGDLLTNFCGYSIEYDEIGNPVRITDPSADYYILYGHEMQWDGRLLTSYVDFELYTSNESPIYTNLLTFTYNSDGIRTSKTVDGVRHEYLLDGSQITAETWMKGSTQYLLYYLYDETGSPIGLKYRTSAYAKGEYDCFFFEKNLQGDIVAVYNSTGTKIGSYTYDAWGNVTRYFIGGASALERSIVGTYNPFRYRGYYYDVETGWYYLQTRYYNPNWGRFVNADGFINTSTGLLGYNMFAYCNNNPINFVDPAGTSIIGIIGLCLIGTGAVFLITSCSVQNPGSSESSVTYVNPFSEEAGYVKSDSENAANVDGFEALYEQANQSGFSNEYGFIVYQFKEGNPYGESSDYFWRTPISKGLTSKWDPNNTKIPWDHVNIISVVHLHVDQDPRTTNGGFSGKDYEGIYQDREVCSNQYVMVLGRVLPEYTGRYQVYKFNYVINKGEIYYNG